MMNVCTGDISYRTFVYGELSCRTFVYGELAYRTFVNEELSHLGVVECLIRDRGAAGSSFTDVTAFFVCFVLILYVPSTIFQL